MGRSFKGYSDYGRERDYFISVISVSEKVEPFGLSRKKTLINKNGNRVCQKAVPDNRCRLLEDVVVGPHEQKNNWGCLIASHPNLCKRFTAVYSCLAARSFFMTPLDTSTQPCGLSAGPPGCSCADTALHWPAHGKRSHAMLPWSHWTHSCGLCWLEESWHHTASLQAFCGLFWEICCDFQSCNAV